MREVLGICAVVLVLVGAWMALSPEPVDLQTASPEAPVEPVTLVAPPEPEPDAVVEVPLASVPSSVMSEPHASIRAGAGRVLSNAAADSAAVGLPPPRVDERADSPGIDVITLTPTVALPEAPASPPARPLDPLPEPPRALAAPAPAGRSAAVAIEMTAVQQVLNRYRQMYGSLDASAVASFWPDADARALARVFAGLSRQELDFEECVIALAESTANVQCEGWLRYVPKVGNAKIRTERHSWNIQLQRAAADWSIVRVNAR